MAIHNETGSKGERIALAYLQKQGYRILDTNWHARHYEIDIIARDGNELVIVEVKTRTSEAFGHPSEAVDNRKMTRLINAAERYIHKYKLDVDTRFDIISVIFSNGRYRIEHIRDAFYPTAK